MDRAGQSSLRAIVYGVTKEMDTTELLSTHA